MLKMKNKFHCRLSLPVYAGILDYIYDANYISDFDDDNYLPYKNERGCIRTNHVYKSGEEREDVNCREGR